MLQKTHCLESVTGGLYLRNKTLYPWDAESWTMVHLSPPKVSNTCKIQYNQWQYIQTVSLKKLI